MFNAIRFALTFLSFEELESHERPPKRIWLDSDALNDWFANVKKQRTEQASGKAIDDPVQNEAAKSLIVG